MPIKTAAQSDVHRALPPHNSKILGKEAGFVGKHLITEKRYVESMSQRVILYFMKIPA
jgi:hypothetical protein